MLAAIGLALPLACGPAPQTRPAVPADVQRLERLAGGADEPFVASGRARFVSADDEVEGDLRLRVAPPDRAWLEVRSRALFGMVGERVVASLPGDGYLVVLQERAARLDRVPFDSTEIAAVCPGRDAAALLALSRGRLPAGVLRDAAAARVAGASPADRFEFALSAANGGGTLRLQLDGDRLRELEWRTGGERRLWVRYGDYARVGAGEVPTRLWLDAPGAGIRAEVQVRDLEARPGFQPGDFDVGRVGNPQPNRGVSHG